MFALMVSREVEARAGDEALQGKCKIFQTAVCELQDLLYANLTTVDQV